MLHKILNILVTIVLRLSPAVLGASLFSIIGFDPASFRLVGWAVLSLYTSEMQKRIEELARRALSNMPKKYASIEKASESSSSPQLDAENRKAAVKIAVERIVVLDNQSKRLCRILPLMGLLDFLGIQAMQRTHVAFLPVHWITFFPTLFFIMFLLLTILFPIFARKEAFASECFLSEKPR